MRRSLSRSDDTSEDALLPAPCADGADVRESESRLRQVVESAESVFILYQLHPAAYLYISPNCSTLLGLDESQLLTNMNWLVHVDDQARIESEYRAAVMDGQRASSSTSLWSRVSIDTAVNKPLPAPFSRSPSKWAHRLSRKVSSNSPICACCKTSAFRLGRGICLVGRLLCRSAPQCHRKSRSCPGRLCGRLGRPRESGSTPTRRGSEPNNGSTPRSCPRRTCLLLVAFVSRWRSLGAEQPELARLHD